MYGMVGKGDEDTHRRRAGRGLCKYAHGSGYRGRPLRTNCGWDIHVLKVTNVQRVRAQAYFRSVLLGGKGRIRPKRIA